ncbi:hypothetical protein E4K67_13540 [Desulfosporosinus fructosivorans]|uniref:Uncharacterized protein n=2 Tax=Desulfosporosinus fructosivorans TaxID=2018669 RepID=A0A4Z0R5C8_9FIRM|nr:hypothetical protein E4K67_13540 [Desulfosporosinus fructosivorans]
MSADEVLKVPLYTYEDYLAIDPDSGLYQTEFEEFIRNFHLLRLLLLYAMLVDRKVRGQIKVSMEDLAKTFIETLKLSYQDNEIDSDEAQRLSEVFSLELDHLTSFIENIPEKDLSKKGFTPYTCLYVTAKLAESSERSVKNGVYIALINTQRMIMKEYFENAIEKIKIVMK